MTDDSVELTVHQLARSSQQLSTHVYARMRTCIYRACTYIASFPGSPSFRAIIPCMTFDPPQRKAEGEPGRFCHMTRVMPRHRVYVSVLCVL